jgi:hypothetical protein
VGSWVCDITQKNVAYVIPIPTFFFVAVDSLTDGNTTVVLDLTKYQGGGARATGNLRWSYDALTWNNVVGETFTVDTLTNGEKEKSILV